MQLAWVSFWSKQGEGLIRPSIVVGRQHQGMDRPGVGQASEGSGEQGKMEKTGCKIICGAPKILSLIHI